MKGFFLKHLSKYLFIFAFCKWTSFDHWYKKWTTAFKKVLFYNVLNMRQCGQCNRCPQKNRYIWKSRAPKFELVNICEQDIGTSVKSAHTACQLSKITHALNLKLWKFEFRLLKLHNFDQSYATFTSFSMIQSRAPSQHDWQVKLETFEAILVSCWLRLAILRALYFLHVTFFGTPSIVDFCVV